MTKDDIKTYRSKKGRFFQSPIFFVLLALVIIIVIVLSSFGIASAVCNGSTDDTQIPLNITSVTSLNVSSMGDVKIYFRNTIANGSAILKYHLVDVAAFPSPDNTFRLQDGTLSVDLRPVESLFTCASASMELWLPSGLNSIDLVYVSSSNGAVLVDVDQQVNINYLELRSTNEGILVNGQIISGKVFASSTNSDIEFKDLVAAEVELSTTNSNIKGKISALSLSASTTNADIDISQLYSNGSNPLISLSSTNGKVTFNMENTGDLLGTFDLSTTNSNAKVQNSGPALITKTNDSKTIQKGSINGGGEASINLSTTNNDVTFNLK